MQIAHSHHLETSTYPGSYRPASSKFDSLDEELSKFHEGAMNPAANICETADYYKIELAAPGLQREDFFVNVNQQGQLCIAALHGETQQAEKKETYRKHAFNYECFREKFVLPENVDTDFVKAEYRTGILSLWFLRTKTRQRRNASTIIVY